MLKKLSHIEFYPLYVQSVDIHVRHLALIFSIISAFLIYKTFMYEFEIQRIHAIQHF